MKYVFAALISLLFVPAAFADTPVVRWDSIVGVITSPGVDNPVADIHGGATPWTTTRGQATINLENGGIGFFVQGLVINGGTSTGTTGPISSVIGTLVCNAGKADDARVFADDDDVVRIVPTHWATAATVCTVLWVEQYMYSLPFCQ